MTGAEICNLMDSLTKRGIKDSEIIKILYEVEGRVRPEPGQEHRQEEEKE